MNVKNTDKILDTRDKSVQFVKNKIFDAVAIGIIVAMTALSLGVIELREITFNQIVNIVIECIPFYIAATMLSVDYYTKGSFVGKETDVFIKARDYYSEQVNNLTGEQMTKLHDFCNEYNERILYSMQEALLKSVAITMSAYNDGTDKIPPLKILPKSKLKQLYGRDVINVIIKCKHLKIKGIHPNILLGTLNRSDSSDLGPNEKELANKRKLSYASSYLFSILLLSLIGIKNIMQWGWMGAFLTLFKVSYVAAGAYMKYFNGYEDITINVVNHMYRKTDILKEFYFWYEHNKSVDADVTTQVIK